MSSIPRPVVFHFTADGRGSSVYTIQYIRIWLVNREMFSAAATSMHSRSTVNAFKMEHFQDCCSLVTIKEYQKDELVARSVML